MNKNQAKQLKKLIQNHVDAQVALSWKGSLQDAAEIEAVVTASSEAAVELNSYITDLVENGSW